GSGPGSGVAAQLVDRLGELVATFGIDQQRSAERSRMWRASPRTAPMIGRRAARISNTFVPSKASNSGTSRRGTRHTSAAVGDDQQIGHFGLGGGGGQDRAQSVREAVAADIGHHESPVPNSAREVAPSTRGDNRRVSAPFGMTSSLLRGTPSAASRSANAFGDHDDASRLSVKKVGQAFERLHRRT